MNFCCNNEFRSSVGIMQSNGTWGAVLSRLWIVLLMVLLVFLFRDMTSVLLILSVYHCSMIEHVVRCDQQFRGIDDKCDLNRWCIPSVQIQSIHYLCYYVYVYN